MILRLQNSRHITRHSSKAYEFNLASHNPLHFGPLRSHSTGSPPFRVKMTTHQVSLADFGITPEPLTSAQRAMRNEVALKDLSTSLGGWTTLPGWGHGIISYYDEADIKAKKRNKTKWYKMVPAGQQYFVHGNSFSDLGDQKGYALEVVYPDDPKKNKYVHTGPLHVFNKTEQIADLIYGGPIPAGWEVFHEGTKIKNPGLEVKRDRKKYLTELGPEKTFLPRLFFLTSALNDRWVLVAGRSAFPMNTKDRMKYNSPWNDYGMPHNRWAIVSRDSLRIHLKADLWGINTSAAEKAWWVNQHHAVTYPMFHIAPDDS
ncbi:hypothetical protein F5Y16DRAFT_131154 [Xylariaceae sp. FL0255]|nr:hypothetical protein F5Y16DRAFT_131154 [Xylariaceae sp. FL0255]